MHRIIGFLIFLTAFGWQSAAQNNLNVHQIEPFSYRLYEQAKWDSLIIVSSKALNMGIDYHYLRLRLGIAFYNKGNYFLAAHHLEKALSFDSESWVARSYLFGALLYSGFPEAATKAASRVPKSRRAEAKVFTKKIIQSFGAEAGVFKPSDEILQEYAMFSPGLENQNHYYAWASFLPVAGLSLSPGIGTIVGKSQIPITQAGKPRYYNYRKNQNIFQIRLAYAPGNRLRLRTSINYVAISQPVLEYDASGQLNSATYSSFHNFVMFAGLDYRLQNVALDAGFSRGKLDEKEIFAPAVSFTWHPLGNHKIKTLSGFSLNRTDGIFTPVITQKIGLKFSNAVYLETGLIAGELYSHIENDGLLLNNLVPETDFAIKSLLDIRLSPKTSFFLKHNVFTQSNIFKRKNNKIEFQPFNHYFTGGLTWNL